MRIQERPSAPSARSREHVVNNTLAESSDTAIAFFRWGRHVGETPPIIHATRVETGEKAEIRPIDRCVTKLIWPRPLRAGEEVALGLPPTSWVSRIEFINRTNGQDISDEVLRFTRTQDDLELVAYQYRNEISKRCFRNEPTLRRACDFFTYLDQQTAKAKPDIENWRRRIFTGTAFEFKRLRESLPPGVATQEISFRQTAVSRLLGLLRANVELRAGRYPNDTEIISIVDRRTRSEVECIAEVLIDAMVRFYRDDRSYMLRRAQPGFDWISHLGSTEPKGAHRTIAPGFASLVDHRKVDIAFELFANGALRPAENDIKKALRDAGANPDLIAEGLPLAHFQPDGDNYFLFAELAITCARMGYHRPLMTEFARTAVRTAWILAARYAEGARGKDSDHIFKLQREAPSPASLDTETITRLRWQFRRMKSLSDIEHEFAFLLSKAYPRTRRNRRLDLVRAERLDARRAELYDQVEPNGEHRDREARVQ